MTVREVTGDEKAQWWERAVAAYPPYAEYQEKTDRQIPVFVATRSRGLNRSASARRRRTPRTMAARHGTRTSSRSSGVLPRRTTTRSRAGQMVIDWPS